jgi:serine/threonine protein kinase
VEGITNQHPRLQVKDLSSPSKPDNYRTSRVIPVFREDAHDTSIWDDWSGRGSHVDFGRKEKIPLEQGRFLGHGMMGGVYETHCKGVAVAWKRRYCRRKIGEAEMKEINILKKLDHHHIIQLVGTYTQSTTRGQFLGLLLWPVAVCDLATFLEDSEAIDSDSQAIDEDRSNRLKALGLLEDPDSKDPIIKFAFSMFGCLSKAIEFLHSQRIRHKDLKPSNILLGRAKLWLTDFGSSTDFSLLSMSATEDGERGTPKYFAPEVAAYEPNGRAADIFSLGCIYLEMIACFQQISKDLKALRTEHDGSFQANLHRAPEWFKLITANKHPPPTALHLVCELKLMLLRDAKLRPTAADLSKRLGLIEYFDRDTDARLFGKCCMTSYLTDQEHKAQLKPLQDQVASLQVEQRLTQVRLESALKEIEHLQKSLTNPLASFAI